DLDELGDIMPEMLITQDEVEVGVVNPTVFFLLLKRLLKCDQELNDLQNQLLTIEHLRERFVSYQTAFNKLILELARRTQYREAVENIVRGMMSQLSAMTE
ncbi:hypothetical protein H0H93_004746, partial [Arthromyces matolae]